MKKAVIKCEKMIIPTYEVGGEEKNPMFFEKRVYQGSSGKVYPNPVIEKIYDEKIDKEYNAVILENDYVYVVVLPELGGRIYTAYDKTNNYDFVYHNHVIKPALVGLLGPWISGGIEFNWPQHHRPSTYMPCNYKINEYADGSVSVVMSEIDNMFSLKENTEIKIYADKSIIEINAQIYNRSDLPQTFLWWANPAYKVNDYTKTVMPPDVTAVMDHGKRAVSTFPIATGEYYKMDYSKGVDISRYKNIEVPTSFMAYKSNFDFVGAYDFQKRAGLYHFADHHISPGKKQWTWGCGDFGQAWDRNLTDEDGPYIELMTGCFTDNQPDFTFILPEEEKNFTQYFMPYRNVGNIKNANRDFCLNIEDNTLFIHSTGEYKNVQIVATKDGVELFSEVVDFTPAMAYEKAGVPDDAKITIKYGIEKLEYHKSMIENIPVPDPATACPEPKDCKTLEELYLYGLHIEQYRHATRLPEDYYKEGLARDNTDSRINNAYGLLLLRRGLFEESIKYFDASIDKLTCKNPNPATTEPYYNKGVACVYLKRYAEAFDCFYKCIWSNENKTGAYYYLAVIAYINRNLTRAIEFVDKSIQFNSHNLKAYNLKGRILLALNEREKAKATFESVETFDRMDTLSEYELELIENREHSSLKDILPMQILNISNDYLVAENYAQAVELLEDYCKVNNTNHPLVMLYIAYAKDMLGVDASNDIETAINNAKVICFPVRLRDIVVLKHILNIDKNNYLANYYLGNIYYDKKQYDLAQGYWNDCVVANDKFPTAFRNLALYYYNKAKNADKAVECLEKAYQLDKNDSRIMMELFQLYQITDKTDKELYDFLTDNLQVALDRDDMCLEYIALACKFVSYEYAEELIHNRHFHPWEGGEGKVTKLFKVIKTNLAKKLAENGDYSGAIAKISETLSFPHNLGEGKLVLDYDNDIHYTIGEYYEQLGNSEKAKEHFELACRGNISVSDNMYYNDNPIEYQYYMALAYKKLGNTEVSDSIKNAFAKFYQNNFGKKQVIDYFAVSLPDMLIWEQDINKKNDKFCEYVLELSKKI